MPAKKKKSKKLAELIGRLGPPRNLRPAGAHKDRKRKRRQDVKVALQRELAEEEAEP